MKFVPIVFLLLAIACSPTSQSNPVVEAHVEAFNAGDIDAMSSFQHPDIEWFSVSGSTLNVDVSGREALAEVMRDYLATSPGTTGSLRDWSINGNFVAVTETARWTDAEGMAKAQSALSVYELEDGLIRRVWYYPAVRDEPDANTD